MTDAIVLAGGPLERDRFPDLDPDLPGKAAVPLLGVPMVAWVARALRAVPEVGRIVLVGPPGLLTDDLRALGATLEPGRDTIFANLRAGLDALPEASRLLIASADLPLVTPEALSDLLENAPRAAVVFPYVERADIERAYPDRTWIYAKTPDGDLTGSAVFLAEAPALREQWPWVERLLDARRSSVLGLAALVGPSFLLKYLLHRLRVADVEARMSKLLHVAARGYRTRFADLAMDVDKSSDIPLAEGILRGRMQAAG